MKNKKENNKINNFKKKKVSDAFKNTMIIYVTTFIGVSIINKTIDYFKETFNKGIDASDIVVTLLPFIVTTLSIVLSFSDKKIFGISYKSFKNIKRDSCFSFSEMIYFVIFTFIFYAIAAYFKLELTIILIDIFSIVFSFLFIYKEMPLIENNEEKLIQDVAKVLGDKINKKSRIFINEYGDIDDLIKVIGYLIVTKGLKYSFNQFEESNGINKVKLFIIFLKIYSSYLKYFLKENYFHINNDNIDNIYKLFEKSFKNLNSIVTDEYFTKIYKKNNSISKSVNIEISNILYYLYQISKRSLLNDYYKNNLFNIIGNLDKFNFGLRRPDIYFNFFKISVINTIVFNTMGLNNDFDFLNIKSNSENNIPYILTIDPKYSFYLAIILSSITDEIHFNFDKKISKTNKFINTQFDYKSKKVSFYEFLNSKLKVFALKDIINLLPIYLELFDSTYGKNKEKNYDSLYFYIIDSWIELLFYYYFSNKLNYQSQVLEEMLNQFSEKERIEISKRLNLWFNNMNFKMSKIKFLGKICPNFTNFNFNQSERIINDLFKFKNDTLKVYTKKFYLNKDIITELTNSIENGVDENLHLIRFRDDNLKYKITIAPYLNYLDIINFNGFYGGFSFKFVKSYINKIINNHMKSLNVTNDKAELASKIDSIVNDPTSERTDNIGRFSSKIDINEYKKLSEIQENTYIKSKNFLAWQADGIKLNLQLGKIEKVNNNDVINDIIRRNSKLKFNNLYKVFINYEINYIYLTEEEFKDLISNTLLNVPFEYDIKFDPDKIVFFK